MKGVTKAIKNEAKEQKGGFLGMLLGTLGASLLGNMLPGQGIVKAGYGNKEGKAILQTLKFKNIIKLHQDLMDFLQKIIYLKKQRVGLI